MATATARANGERVQFSGKLVGRGLNLNEQEICVVLRDVFLDGRKIRPNVGCTPVSAFAQIGSFEKSEITGVGELKRNTHGEYSIVGCKWVELADPIGLLPESEHPPADG